jgi:hypothetical protein
MIDFEWNESDYQAEEIKVTLYFCINCNKYTYNLPTPVQVNTFTKCGSCKNDIYIPPKVELRDDWYIWYSYIKDYKLFHITDESNIASIKKYGGLYSWSYLEKNKIHIPRPGGNQLSRNLDTRKDLQDYVRLNFNQNPPMFYKAQREGRIIKPVIYAVNPIVILLKGNKFSNINATDNNAIIGEDISNFFQINYNIASKGTFTNEDEKKLIQAEILIKTHIPISFLTNNSEIVKEDLPF